jgi:NAD+ diphosphatase
MRVYWFVVRPKTTGVKCVLTRGEEVLLVRHEYGRRDVWDLPGGGVKRGESGAEAARREVREEVGCDVVGWRHVGTFHLQVDRKDNKIHGFAAAATGADVAVDGIEIAEARWFESGRLPSPRAPWVSAFAAKAVSVLTEPGGQ